MPTLKANIGGTWVPIGYAPPSLFTSTQPGIVPASGGGTVNFLRADGTWGQPTATVGWPLTAPADATGHLRFTPSNTDIAGLRPTADANSWIRFWNGPPTSLYLKANSGPLTAGSMGEIFIDADRINFRDSAGPSTHALITSTQIILNRLTQAGAGGPVLGNHPSHGGNGSIWRAALGFAPGTGYSFLMWGEDTYLNSDNGNWALRVSNATYLSSDRANARVMCEATNGLQFPSGGGWMSGAGDAWIRTTGSKNIYTPTVIRADQALESPWFRCPSDNLTGIQLVVNTGVLIQGNYERLRWDSNGCHIRGDLANRIRLYHYTDDNHHIRFSNDSASYIHPSSGEAMNGVWIQGYANICLKTGAGSSYHPMFFNGNCNIDAARAYAKFSTIENKDDITPLDQDASLAQVLQWRPVRFRVKHSGEYTQGLIAEELHRVSPQAVVVTGPQAARPNWPNAIDYGHLTVWLTAAIQALTRRLEALEAV